MSRRHRRDHGSGLVRVRTLKCLRIGIELQIIRFYIPDVCRGETKRDQERQRETKRDKERPQETKRDQERPRETKRDHERQRETKRDQERL